MEMGMGVPPTVAPPQIRVNRRYEKGGGWKWEEEKREEDDAIAKRQGRQSYQYLTPLLSLSTCYLLFEVVVPPAAQVAAS
jgi:hypothetical protein